MSIVNGGFSYKDVEVLKGIHIHIKNGEMLTILGPNGVGKTTLIKCFLGFYKWTEGTTLLDGNPINAAEKRLFWKKVSYVPQAKEIPTSYTVKSVVLMGRNPFIHFFGKPSNHDMEEVDHVLQLLGLTELQHKYMYQLSGGEKQMVLIARALVSNPELIVLDEPELNLDLANQNKIYATLQWLVKCKGISCLVNTHHPFNAMKYSDYALLLKKDTTYLYGKTEEVVTLENIIHIFDLPQDYYQIHDKGIQNHILCS